MTTRAQLSTSYDDIADVLYVHVCRPMPRTKNEEVEAGLVLRYDVDSHDPVGATIVDFKSHWMEQRRHLETELSRFFHITGAEASSVLSSI